MIARFGLSELFGWTRQGANVLSAAEPSDQADWWPRIRLGETCVVWWVGRIRAPDLVRLSQLAGPYGEVIVFETERFGGKGGADLPLPFQNVSVADVVLSSTVSHEAEPISVDGLDGLPRPGANARADAMVLHGWPAPQWIIIDLPAARAFDILDGFGDLLRPEIVEHVVVRTGKNGNNREHGSSAGAPVAQRLATRGYVVNSHRTHLHAA